MCYFLHLCPSLSAQMNSIDHLVVSECNILLGNPGSRHSYGCQFPQMTCLNGPVDWTHPSGHQHTNMTLVPPAGQCLANSFQVIHITPVMHPQRLSVLTAAFNVLLRAVANLSPCTQVHCFPKLHRQKRDNILSAELSSVSCISNVIPSYTTQSFN